MGLPTLNALTSVTIKKYFFHGDEAIKKVRDILQSCEKDVASPKAFQLVVYEDNSDLVHIKSFHNGIYWCPCTLFKPEAVVQPQPDNQNISGFRHVQLGNFMVPFYGTSFHALLNAHQPTPTDKQIFVVINKETLG